MRFDSLRRSLNCAMVSLVLAVAAASQGWVARSTFVSPPARTGHGLAHDSARGVAVLFGGDNGTATAFADTWEWNGFGWGQRVTPSAPTPRWGHSMVYDTRRSRVVLFGGYAPTDPAGSQADTWEWDGATWTHRFLPVQPPARGYHGMTYDSWRGHVLVFGGVTGAGQHLDDTWAFNGVTWAQVASVTRPSARRGVAVAFDDNRGQTVLFGGGDGSQVLGDTWLFDGANWQQTAATGPAARQEARLAHDGLCGHTVLHGGADHAFATNYGDSWAWDGAGWVPVAGAAPQGRHGAAMAFDAQRGQMLLWGGRSAGGFFGDAWQLASGCSRTMSVVTAPQLLMPAVFRYSYPQAAAGHFGVHLLTLHQAGGFPVPIPGFLSFGECFVDLFSVQLQTFTLLDGSGVSDLTVQMPGDPYLVGLAFDVQAVDISFQASAVYWSDSDLELAIEPQPAAPLTSFTTNSTAGYAPLAINFIDTSVNSPTSWQWDFDNDGLIDSTQQSPVHTYTAAGLYSVRLVASNLGGSTTLLRSNWIYVGPFIPNPAIDLVPVASGTFQMGSTAFSSTSAPVHPVTITRPFLVGRFEVTQAEYQALMGSNPSYWQAPQRPVEQVSWGDAMSYCAAQNAIEAAAGRLPFGYQYRLPTEAEWEYACRAGTTTDWNTGASLATTQANFGSVFTGQTTLVGSYPANAWGLFDMHGNVFEWCLDGWDGSVNYPSTAVSDPYVPNGPYRVRRGGCWGNTADGCRSALRTNVDPSITFNGLGFRVVLAPILVP